MLKLLTVEEARRKLGRLVEEVSRTRQPVILTRRGRDQTVLLAAEEYERLKGIEEAYARMAFQRALEAIGQDVARTGVARSAVDEATRWARQEAGATPDGPAERHRAAEGDADKVQ